MKWIRDSIHQDVAVDGVAERLLDTPPMQRLRHIKQLGLATHAFPSANHTRFEHSIGVYQLAGAALDSLDVDPYLAKHARVAALLHDIGHAPYSHTLEDLLVEHTGTYHDERTDLITAGTIGDVLRRENLDPDLVTEYIQGEGRLGQLIASDLDVDRMDYLLRDAHHTGVPYGVVDATRLVRELTFVDDDLVVTASGVRAAESLLVSRALMMTVYHHHVSRISGAMLARATERLLETTDIAAEMVQQMDDHDLLVTLRRTDATADLAHRLDRRQLYKCAGWLPPEQVPLAIQDADRETVREYEREIAAVATEQSAASVREEDVIVDVPGPLTTDSISVGVHVPETATGRWATVTDEVVELTDWSPLVSVLQASERAHWRCGVYAPAAVREAVMEAMQTVIVDDATGDVAPAPAD